MEKITLKVTFENYKPLKEEKCVRLIIDTQELTSEQAGLLHSMKGSYGELTFVETAQPDAF